MKIEHAYTIVTSPGRNFVTLKIVTDQGVYGVGDATLNGREMAQDAIASFRKPLTNAWQGICPNGPVSSVSSAR